MGIKLTPAENVSKEQRRRPFRSVGPKGRGIECFVRHAWAPPPIRRGPLFAHHTLPTAAVRVAAAPNRPRSQVGRLGPSARPSNVGELVSINPSVVLLCLAARNSAAAAAAAAAAAETFTSKLFSDGTTKMHCPPDGCWTPLKWTTRPVAARDGSLPSKVATKICLLQGTSSTGSAKLRQNGREICQVQICLRCRE